MPSAPRNVGLAFTQGSPQWEKYRQRFLGDLYWAASVVLGYADLIPMEPAYHALLCKFLERKTGVPDLDSALYRKVETPREIGKTTLGTIARSIQCICRDPDTAIMIANEKQGNAMKMLAEIKRHFLTNDFLRALFPEVCPATEKEADKWSQTEIHVRRTTTRKEPTIAVVGVGSALASMHYDKLIIDDPISREAMENARAGSWNIMEGVNRWIHQLEALLSWASPEREVLFIGTIWWHGDSYAHIEQAYGYGETPRKYMLRLKLPDGTVQQIMAFRVGDLAVFRRAGIEDGRPAFPKIWPQDRMDRLRSIDPALFAANIMNDPSSDETSAFRDSWLNYYDRLDEHTIRYTDAAAAKRTVRISDLDTLVFLAPGAFSLREADQKAHGAICVTGSTAQGEHLLLEAYSEQDTLLMLIRKTAEFCTRYQPRKLVLQFSDQQTAFIELVRKTLHEHGVTVTLEVIPPGTQGIEMRIHVLEPWFERGRMFLGRGSGFQEFRTQYRQFPRAMRFDLLAALSYAPTVWKRQSGAATTEERRAQELATYKQRRGLRV